MDLATAFRSFAEYEAAGLSPLYKRLALDVADDPDLLAMLAGAGREQRRPTLFFAAVHDVVLAGGLSYPASGAALRAFCTAHRAAVLSRIDSRHTQTNEIARCAQFLPALGVIAAQAGRPLGLIELGASAGLNLLLDRFRYRYVLPDGTVVEVGDPFAGVVAECAIRGDVPPIPHEIPPIGARVGIDLVPVDVRDLEQVRWLRACVWPEHIARRQRLDAAIRLAQTEMPEVIAGDAAERLAEAADRIPRQQALVVFHSSTLPYFSDADHARLRAAMRALAEEREVFWLFSEAAGLVADLVDVSGLPERARPPRRARPRPDGRRSPRG